MPSRIEITTPTNLNNELNSEIRFRSTLVNENYVENKLLKEFLSETLGMYFFVLLSLGNVAIYVLFPESKITWDGVAISWGLNLMFGIYLASFNSSGHLNPCVSMCVYIFDRSMTFTQLCLYSLAQLVGAFLASVTVYGIYYNNIKLLDDKSASSIFTTYKNDSITTTSAFFTEFIGTALLVGGIFAIIKNKETTKHIPIYVGLLLTSIVLSFGWQSAFALNPARDFGPRIFMAMLGFDTFSFSDYYFWVPLVADYCGAIFGVLVFNTINRD